MTLTINNSRERAACLFIFRSSRFISPSLSSVGPGVGGQQLAVSDADTAPDELEFELVEAPIHGELIKTDGSTHTGMTNGEMTRTLQMFQ